MVDLEQYPVVGGARRGDIFADVVGDGAEFHSGGNKGAALDEGIPNARTVSEDVDQFFNPNRIFDGVRLARKHFEGTHGAEGAVDEERDIIGLDRAGVAGFDDDGRLAVHRSGVIEIARGSGISGTFAPDNNVVEAEGKDHFLGDAILSFVASGAPISVGAEALVEVAAMVVDEVVAAVDDFLGDEVGGALGLRAVGFAGVKTVHAFIVDGIDVGDFLFEGLNVDERDEDDGARDLRGVEGGDEFFDGDDGDVFGAVRAGDEREDFAGLGAAYDDDGNAGGRIDAGGDFESAGGFFAGSGGGGADCEFRLRRNGHTTKRNEKQGAKNRITETHHSPT